MFFSICQVIHMILVWHFYKFNFLFNMREVRRVLTEEKAPINTWCLNEASGKPQDVSLAGRVPA